MSLNFKDILEAARSIVSATADLIRFASAIQREPMARGTVRKFCCSNAY